MDMDIDALLERLFRLEWLLRFHYMRTYRDRGPMANAHRGQGRILSLLKLKPDISQKEASQASSTSAPNPWASCWPSSRRPAMSPGLRMRPTIAGWISTSPRRDGQPPSPSPRTIPSRT